MIYIRDLLWPSRLGVKFYDLMRPQPTLWIVAASVVILLVIRVPLFGLLLVILVTLTRIYYRFRFQMVYPRLDF